MAYFNPYYNPWDDPLNNPYLHPQAQQAAPLPDPTDPGGSVPPTDGGPETRPNQPTTPTTTPTNPTTPTTPTPNPNPTTTPYSDSAFQAIMRKYAPSREGRQQAMDEANKTFGLNLSWFGSKLDKVKLPDGRVIDAVIGSGTANPQWGWMDTANSGTTGPTDLSQVSLDPSYYAAWEGHAPDPGVMTFDAPADFKAPTAEDLKADPSYQFRLSQGAGTLENSAFAKGLGGSSGSLVDILNYGQKAASQEYGNVFDRNFGVWNSTWANKLGAFRANQDSNNSAYQRAWNAYTDARDNFYHHQDSAFDKLYRVASLGAGAAGG